MKSWNWFEMIEVVHTTIILLFIVWLVYRTSMQSFQQFVNTLHSPGASVLVGYVLIITGVVMMKIALMEDGKYIVGAGAGILGHALAGSGVAPSGSTSDVTTTKTTTSPKG